MKKIIYQIISHNIFIISIVLSVLLFFTILININYLLPDNSNVVQTYTDEKISYSNALFGNSDFSFHPYSPFDANDTRHKLTPEEAEKYLNSDGFQKIKTAMLKYNLFHENCTADDILPYLKYNAYINQTPFGESIYIHLSSSNLSLYFTPDGKNISFSYLNNLSTGKIEDVKLDFATRQSYIENCKVFLSTFSPEVANSFSPDTIQLDEYGITYFMKDTKNNITIDYWIVKNKPLGFQFGYI